MFTVNTDNQLVYIKSTNIKVFPCGRRRSELVDTDGNENTVSDRYYIPIDPEARLNTEANNRKHSGLNGFKQTYIEHWDTNTISLVLNGYLFNIKLVDRYKDSDSGITNLGNDITSKLKVTPESGSALYANIITADVEFFSSVDGSGSKNVSVSTEILRDQQLNGQPATCLDSYDGINDGTKATSYYFSGLSISSVPLEETRSDEYLSQRPFSLRLLDYDEVEGSWHIHEASRLPKIEHGDTEDSVRIPGDLRVDGDLQVVKDASIGGSMTASDVIIKGADGDMHAITLKVVQTNSDTWQLQFHNANTSQSD